MRALWTGSISFGLVNIPVRLLSASKERALKFKMLDKRDLSPIHFERVSEKAMRAVPQKDIVKGYEVNSGEFVVLDEEDFRAADAKRTDTMEITSFTDPASIEPKYFDTPFYIEPQKKSAKAYALLRDALKKSGQVAVVRYVMRERERIGALFPEGRAILLDQLRFQDEIKAPDDLDLPAGGYSEREMEMALALVKELDKPFDPGAFKDTYADALRRIIKEKSKGRTPRAHAKPAPKPTEVSDILEMLKRSLAQESAAR